MMPPKPSSSSALCARLQRFYGAFSSYYGSGVNIGPWLAPRHLRAASSASIAESPPGRQLETVARRKLVKDAKPFSEFLTDTFHRQHDYLRISVTERCNLRCLYCMPEEGVPLSPPRQLLTTPEIVILSSIFVSQGVSKIRLTGGEPTVRRDITSLMRQIGALKRHGLRELCLTTNGLSLHRKLDDMVAAGLTGVNLSLDTLDPWQFQIMTRRQGFDMVKRSIDRIIELNKNGAGIKFKINCVVMRGINDREVLPFVEMTRENDVEVRFIEYMPFDGNKWSEGKMFSYAEMLDLIREEHPGLEKVRDHKNDTSKTWRVPGFVGRIGFITSMTHNFCGTCNRLRVTSDGNLKVCLFGNAEVSLRDILRKSNGGNPIDEEAFAALEQAYQGRGQAQPSGGSLAVVPNESELLDVIGSAVKRKKARHAGIGKLEHMKNRPMILIDPILPSARMNSSHPSATSSARQPLGLFGFPDALRGPHTSTLQPYGQSRLYSTSPICMRKNDATGPALTHVSDSGSAHMVSISEKESTLRVATAVASVVFSNNAVVRLIHENQMKKGDVLGVARVAGIMASKRTADLIPLCHPIAVSRVTVDLSPDEEGQKIDIRATVSCEGKTGVEMEALTAASTTALTIYDMCKAVDRGMVIEGLRIVLKEGGRSGRWEMP